MHAAHNPGQTTSKAHSDDYTPAAQLPGDRSAPHQPARAVQANAGRAVMPTTKATDTHCHRLAEGVECTQSDAQCKETA